MKKSLFALAAASLLAGAVNVHASPEDDRMKIVNYFKEKNPSLKIEDYIYGALMFSADARGQYDAMMEFPPYAAEIEKGEKLFKTPFKNGKTYADCLPNGGKMIAGNYPMFDEAKGKVVTFDDLLNECRVQNGETAYEHGDAKTIGLLSAYARTLSDGMKMNIKVESPAAMQAYEDGKKSYYQRVGQFNFSCASCHVYASGNQLRAEYLSPGLGQSTHWPVFRGGQNLVTLQKRYEGCYKSVRHVPDKPGSTRFNNLEYFHAYMSNGLELKASVFRK